MTDALDPTRELAQVRVLIVEDEAIIAQDLAMSLRSMGYTIAGIASRSDEALVLAAQAQPDLVLMDVQIRGDRDGVDTARLIRERFGLPVVFLTAYADEKTLERARGVQPYGYVLKPFQERELHVAVLMAITKHRAVQDLDRLVRARTDELARSEERFRQMSALADLGVFAVRTPDFQAVLDRAAEVACEVLGTDAVYVFEQLPDQGVLVARAGAGASAGEVGRYVVSSGPDTLAGFSLREGAPVTVEDRRRETRIPLPNWQALGVMSGLAAPIHSPVAGAGESAYGVFAAYCVAPRPFTPYEVQFFQAVSNVVAAALERGRAEARMRELRLAAEQERMRAEQANEALRLRDEFLSAASHELRTPLTSLRLQLESLLQRRDSLGDAARVRIERAFQSVARLGRLVESLLDLSRIVSGRLTLHRSEVDLAERVQRVVRQIQPEAVQAGCELVLDADEPVVGKWDGARLDQVLLNLLSNAFKFGAGRAVHVSVRAAGDDALVEVADHGPGIDQKDLTRIFQRFERAAPIEHYGGLGIGLYLCHRLVEAHGGELTVRSTPGSGATFVVRLPREPLSASAASPPGAPS